ncbi:rhodanese-like domain-containing protein [Azohydromonas caseinilytica]|nr:rhodanese-like domain-containing protein [Azohydromonas caseinilytica]
MNRLRVTELQDFLQAHAAQPPVLLDVREPWELQRAALRLPGTRALDIPMQELPARLNELPDDAPIVCLCHHGVRSAHVAAYLARAGFDEVWDVIGGIDAWSQEIDPTLPRY